MGIIGRQLLKVIENTDNKPTTIAWRFPMTDRVEIMSGSQLIVREGQVAIFVKEGRVADVFASGRHKLETRNLPFLTQLLNWNKGFNSPFKAEVYYVTTTQFSGQKWGTANPFTMRDPEFGVIRIRGFGTYSFKVTDPKLFMLELLGSKHEFTIDKIQDHLRSIITSNISDVIASSKFSAIDLSSKLTDFNEIAKTSLQAKFNAIGMTLTSMVVENISFPDEVEKAIDERSSLGIMSDKMGTYVQMQQAKAMRDVAKNPGMPGTFMGMGMMGNMMGGMNGMGGAMAMNSATDASSSGGLGGSGKFCSKCGAQVKASAKFCPECGAKQGEERSCSKCGTAVKPNAKFCPECGEKL